MALTSEEKQILIQVAREAIARAVHGREAPAIDLDTIPDTLKRDGASFVTLTEHGSLRGCIGSLEARRPLIVDVRENAVAAALHDPRFPTVQPHELGDLKVEVSVLSEAQPLAYEDAEDLIAQLRPGVDGVVIEQGWNRATFLPQVWEKIPDPHQFMEHLCRKAHLPLDAYRDPGLDVYTYQVDKFEES
ncbi:MAG TPA: AmmeMemoRadiSam system protein A [Chloroflexi bacterium]|nr:AmmeMemoRadiSam system protein A [Chloroflexota bacterium]